MQDSSNQGGVKLDKDTQVMLEAKSAELKDLLSQIVVQIPMLLQNFKFFNNSFVFNDKDYLKYLSKEATEIKGLLSVYNIHFWTEDIPDEKALRTQAITD